MSNLNDAVDAPTHPRFRERRAEVEDQSIRSRKRKLIAFAIVFTLALLTVAATQSELLDIDEIRIVGAEDVSVDYLRSVAGVELGTPVLGLDTGAVESRLRELPEIASVAASTSWAGVLTIEVEERPGVARIESTAGTIVVAADGIVIEVIQRAALPSEADGGDTAESDPVLEPLPPRVESLPEIAGAMFTTEAGNAVPSVLNDAVVVAAELPSDIAAITERVEISVDELVLRTVGGGAISLGDARDLDEKFVAVRAFLAQVDLSCLESLNVGAPGVPVIRRSSNC